MFAKWWLWVSLTLILCLLIMMCAKMDEAAPLSFLLESPSQSRALNIYDGEDGNYYVFLPSYARLEDLKIELTGDEAVFLGDTKLTDGMDCGGFSPETGYLLRVNDRRMATVWFYRSENVATMYIDTASGSMARIHEDKNYKESAQIELYTDSGALSFSDKSATIKGRGNGTWIREKKPYALKLSTEGNLLDMGSAVDWVLLANALDETNLHNKLIYDFGKQAGFFWTPDCEYVDVWLNGQYNGLYLLAEKVEVHPERLALDTASGDFLCKIEFDIRWNSLRNPFQTTSGRTIEISAPELLQESERQKIIAYVNELDRVILEKEELPDAEIIDLDSWVRRYLVDEIFCNLDADMGSSYFYFKDHVFHAGPLWDYDMTFDNSISTENPNVLYAKTYEKYSGFTSPWYAALYSTDVFLNRVKEIYSSEFRPILSYMLDTGIDCLYADIEAASRMNQIRWSDQSSIAPENDFAPVEAMKNYLTKRISYLSSTWIEGKTYHTIQLKYAPGQGQRYISIEDGALIDAARAELDGFEWLDYHTGETFDFSLPVTQDVILVQQEDTNPKNMWAMRDYIAFASLAALGSLLLCFAGVDLLHRRKERRKIHERTHVSP
jgi:hypothetical protein